MKLSIIVPTLNYQVGSQRNENILRSLKECLVSLQETTPTDVEIVIVSNGGDPKVLPMESSGRRFRRINIWDQGQCRAVNSAVQTTDSEWIMVTNDDMIYPKGWFEKLFSGSSMFDCFSAKLVEPNQGAPTFIQNFCGGAGGDFDKRKFQDIVDNYRVRGYVKGFNLPFVIRRELWDKIGGYDINYDPWGSNSDSDLEYKIRLAGVQPMQNEGCLVYHFSQTSGTFHPDYRSYWEKNYQYFTEKWGFERADSPTIWTASFEIPYEKLKYKPKWAVITRGEDATTA